MPVVGGYLSFIGLYCLEAGFTLMSGKEIAGVQDWGQLATADTMILLAPGLLLGVALVFIDMKFEHYAVLPLCLLSIPLAFHLILLMAGVSLDEARKSFGEGWLAPVTDKADFWECWEHYQFDLVDWSILPSLIPTW